MAQQEGKEKGGRAQLYRLISSTTLDHGRRYARHVVLHTGLHTALATWTIIQDIPKANIIYAIRELLDRITGKR